MNNLFKNHKIYNLTLLLSKINNINRQYSLKVIINQVKWIIYQLNVVITGNI